MTPERRQELLAAIASGDPEFNAIVDTCKQTVIDMLEGEYSSASVEVAKAAIERINSIIKGRAHVLGELKGRRVPVPPSVNVRLYAGMATFELMAAIDAVGTEPRYRS